MTALPSCALLVAAGCLLLLFRALSVLVLWSRGVLPLYIRLRTEIPPQRETFRTPDTLTLLGMEHTDMTDLTELSLPLCSRPDSESPTHWEEEAQRRHKPKGPEEKNRRPEEHIRLSSQDTWIDTNWTAQRDKVSRELELP